MIDKRNVQKFERRKEDEEVKKVDGIRSGVCIVDRVDRLRKICRNQ